MSEMMSPADIAAIGGEGFGNNSAIWLIVLVILFGGWNNRGGEQLATSADVQRGFDTNTITNKLDTLQTSLMKGVCDATYALNNDITNEGRQTQAALATGFCDTSKNIDALRFDMSNYTSQINANTSAIGQKILDKMCENEVQALRDKVNALELARATDTTVKYPTAMTYAYAGNPFCNCGGCCN